MPYRRASDYSPGCAAIAVYALVSLAIAIVTHGVRLLPGDIGWRWLVIFGVMCLLRLVVRTLTWRRNRVRVTTSPDEAVIRRRRRR